MLSRLLFKRSFTVSLANKRINEALLNHLHKENGDIRIKIDFAAKDCRKTNENINLWATGNVLLVAAPALLLFTDHIHSVPMFVGISMVYNGIGGAYFISKLIKQKSERASLNEELARNESAISQTKY